MLTLGIDDAGRGPVIGPMILAGCLIYDENSKEFKKLGIIILCPLFKFLQNIKEIFTESYLSDYSGQPSV